jgi:hypothetical protein
MAFAGQSEDAIALYFGLHKNSLRARFADVLDRGRDRARDAATEALSKKERDSIDAIRRSFDSDWYSPEFGNDPYGGAHTVEEALAWCDSFKGK